MVRLSFHGAAEMVTGSKYLLEAGGRQVLFDCGMFQGAKPLRLLNWDKPRFEPARLDAVVLTHAHIDHIGYLPRLLKEGFRRKIYATPPTVDLTPLQLLDSAHIQEEDADYANRKGFSKHHPALPLYTSQDAEKVFSKLTGVDHGEWFSPAEPIWCRFHDTGHLLGAAMIEVEVREGARPTRILFSGDVGRYNAPLYFDPQPPPACDYLVCESTYGDRDHPPSNPLADLERVVKQAISRGGVLVVPAFAVGRAHQIIYLLQVLAASGATPPIPIYLDSPMAVKAGRIYCDYAEQHDRSEDVGNRLPVSCVLEGRNVHYVETAAASKSLNAVAGPAVIIASSGMMTGGRILHHLKYRLPDARNTVLLCGFMAEGTRGRDLKEGRKFIRLHGVDVPVRAEVESFDGMSGHADRGELLRWLSPLIAPQRTFVTHGEKPSAEAFAELLRAKRGWNVHVPKLGESVELPPPG